MRARIKLFIFGLGYTSAHFLHRCGASFQLLGTTVRGAEKAARFAREGMQPAPLLFNSETSSADADIIAQLAIADALLVSIPPDTDDPVLARFVQEIVQSPIKCIVYLSTIGVYGDHGGDWIDETTPPAPREQRTRIRVDVERAWAGLGARTGKTVYILRLSGIYGPGRNVLVSLRNGTARRTVKPGQVFNRIHVDDIAAAIAACFTGEAPAGLYNITDSEPAPPQDVVVAAARMIGVEPPPEKPFNSAVMSPMARSFWSSSKRVANKKMRETLGVSLACPTYREGLIALKPDGLG